MELIEVIPYLKGALESKTRMGAYARAWWRACGSDQEEIEDEIHDIIYDVEDPKDLEQAFNEWR